MIFSMLAKSESAPQVFRHVFGDAEVISTIALPLVMGGLMAVLLARWGYHLYRARQLEAAPMMTFHRVASHLELSLAQQLLMARVARQQALPTPLTMLLSTGTFHHHANHYLSQSPLARRKRDQAALNAIARHVFGEPVLTHSHAA